MSSDMGRIGASLESFERDDEFTHEHGEHDFVLLPLWQAVGKWRRGSDGAENFYGCATPVPSGSLPYLISFALSKYLPLSSSWPLPAKNLPRLTRAA
jgi:hypothetical protein